MRVLKQLSKQIRSQNYLLSDLSETKGSLEKLYVTSIAGSLAYKFTLI